MTGTGLKKCRPTTLSGRCVADAISVIDNDDVLDARMASGLQIMSSSVKMVFFNVMFSVAASMTRSQSAKSVSCSRARDAAHRRVRVGLRSLPRSTPLRKRALQ